MKRALYIAVQAVWGFPQTLAGAAVCLLYRKRPHFRFHGAIVTEWQSTRGLSLGPFIFLGGGVDEGLLVHEYGHTVQSLILGPLYLPLVGLPSVIWLNHPRLKKKRARERIDYYSFITERSANWLGERILKRPAMGFTLLD